MADQNTFANIKTLLEKAISELDALPPIVGTPMLGVLRGELDRSTLPEALRAHAEKVLKFPRDVSTLSSKRCDALRGELVEFLRFVCDRGGRP
ncbi:MAG TPA: hypothetical protein VIK01_15770 [Polyangiaceae bacterium]